MLFNSLDFLFFFPIAVLGFYIIHPRKIRYIWLLICSYYFYMSRNPVYALLILASTVFTYAGSLIIDTVRKRQKEPLSKLTLILVIVFNLGILIFFKYSNFLLDIVSKLFILAGLTLNIPKFDLILPVGLSFYTFQALGYSIDVYRGKINPEKNFFKYALFVSFFPQLVAGPIERSENLLPQIQNISETKISFPGIYKGLITMLWGLFLKMVIADRIAIVADTVFDKYYLYGGVELIAGVVAFTIQIYCDFYSYSTIAVGAAQVLGISLMENFNVPFFAYSIKDHWRRWHISLSTWFRDYLYIPLGGSRCSRPRKYLNIMIVFLTSGLWHGAAVTYVVWGGLHGLYQIAGEITAGLRKRLREIMKIDSDCFSYKLSRIVGTFALIVLSFVIFRSDGLHAAFSYIGRIFADFDPWVLFDGGLFELGLARPEASILFVSLAALFSSDCLKYTKGETLIDFIMRQNLLCRALSTLVLLLAVLVFGIYGPAYDAQAFIYFQF